MKLKIVSFVLILSASAFAQVDASCVAVQASAAEKRIQALGSAAKPVDQQTVHHIHEEAQQAISEIKTAEKGWAVVRDAALTRLQAVRPSATKEQIEKDLDNRILLRQSAELDNAYADLMLAQYRAHIHEMNEIKQLASIATPNSGTLEKARAAQFVADRKVNAEAVMQSPTLLHLASTMEAARMAGTASQKIPAMALAARPVAGVGFDTAPEKLARLLVEVNAARTMGELTLYHERRLTGGGDSTPRSAIEDRTLASSREQGAEHAGGLMHFVVAQKVAKAIEKLDVTPVMQPHPSQSAVQAVTAAVEQLVVTYRHLAGPPESTPTAPTGVPGGTK